jgi:hypothetical protein
VPPKGKCIYLLIYGHKNTRLELLKGSIASPHSNLIRFALSPLATRSGWNPPFALNIDNATKFQTKDQSIHRLQEGISFGDGADYTLKEYQKMASEWSKEWKRRYYSVQAKPFETPVEPKLLAPSPPESVKSGSHSPSSVTENEDALLEDALRPLMTPENLERDYWDIVETQRLDIDVDYGNDVDTTEFGSGFPLSERGRSVNSTNFLDGRTDKEIPEPEFGTEEFYRETFWNLNNIPNSKNSALRHLKVGINGINVPWL